MSRQLELEKSVLKALSPERGSKAQLKATWSGISGFPTDGPQAYKDWRRIEPNLRRMRLDRSPFVPQNLNEFNDHNNHMKEIYAEIEDIRGKGIEGQVISAAAIACEPALDLDHVIIEARQAKFAKTSVWSDGWEPTPEHAQAPWPTFEEYKEEGDERHTSGFGRFLPIPRVPGNPTVVWKQKSFQMANPVDEVRPVAKKYDHIRLPFDYEVVEPTIDEDGNYVDDQDETGREAKPSSTIARGLSLTSPLSQTLALQDLALSPLRTRDERRSLGDLGKDWPAIEPPHQSNPRTVKSQPALSTMDYQQVPQLDPSIGDLRSRLGVKTGKANCAAHLRGSVQTQGLGERRSHSRGSSLSASSSSGSLYQSSGFKSNPFSILATPDSEHGDKVGRQSDSDKYELLDVLTRPISKSVSFVPSSVGSTDIEPRRRSTVSNAFQPGHRSMYGRNSFSRRDAIIEHIPKKYSKGFDDDGYEFFPPTPRVPEPGTIQDRPAHGHASSVASSDASQIFLRDPNTPTGSEDISPKTKSAHKSAVIGEQHDYKAQPWWSALTFTLQELDLE